MDDETDIRPASPEAIAKLRRAFETKAAKAHRVEWLREAFEKWATRSGYNVERSTHLISHYDQGAGDYAPHGVDVGVYVDFAIELAWCSFLAGDHIGRVKP